MKDIVIEENVLMETLTTYKLKGTVKKVVYPLNIKALTLLINELEKKREKYKVIGLGSNIIFACDYYDGVIIKLNKMSEVKIDGNYIYVKGSYPLMKLCDLAINNNLGGLEYLSGIPGTVLGAVHGNAGSFNHSISEVVTEVEVLLNGEVKTLKNSEMNFGYRTSIFKENSDYILLGAKLKLTNKDKKEMENIKEELMKKRKDTQPLNYPNAGSVFKNPENTSAGKLIDSLGLKGFNVGGAYVSELHANFIINKGECSGSDILKLINIIKKKVKESYNLTLNLEQEIIK